MAVLIRDRYRCVRCNDPGTNVHHREGRGAGGRKGEDRDRTNGLAYLLTLCGSGTTGCHGYIEAHRDESYRQGYLLRRNAQASMRDPHLVPVLTALGWQVFTHDGRRLPSQPALGVE